MNEQKIATMGNNGSKRKSVVYGKRTTEVAAESAQKDEITSTLTLHEGSLLSVTHIDGDRVAVCSDDKSISLVECRKLLREGAEYQPLYLKGHKKSVNLCRGDKRSNTSEHPHKCWSIGRDLSLMQVC